MASLTILLRLVVLFAVLSIIIFIQYEMATLSVSKNSLNKIKNPKSADSVLEKFSTEQLSQSADVNKLRGSATVSKVATTATTKVIEPIHPLVPAIVFSVQPAAPIAVASVVTTQKQLVNNRTRESDDEVLFSSGETEKKGSLMCDGKFVDSEIIYWKRVKGDRHYESPITPHHDEHHDRYLTFEYDHGGWNNVRMGMECLLVFAHATGRTVVIPPAQHLYLLGKVHKDKHDVEEHDEMGFEDFFDIEILKNHLGFHFITMKEFLAREAATGGLHPERVMLPREDTGLSGGQLWRYLNKVADITPEWSGRFVVFPDHAHELKNVTHVDHLHPATLKRLKEFSGDRFGRKPIFYDDEMQNAHHIHVPGDDHHRVLQHHYAFLFFEDRNMQSFYKRFIRDYVRYKDNIQCVGHELVKLVRADSLKLNPKGGGVYYSLHIRRGDLQYKEVKISATDIVRNLNFTDDNGKLIIPPGSLVYISTDDPDGKCKGCTDIRGRNCETLSSPKPEGCPEDPSWDAFTKNGWNLRFLRDYEKTGVLNEINPNTHGMVETIVASRAAVFAGTYFSTFTGYIHRLRGYHGLGDHTYYHHKNYARIPPKRIGHGWWREWKSGWTDDAGNVI